MPFKSRWLTSRWLPLISLLLMAPQLLSCSVPIREETFYTDAGDNGAVVSHFFSTDTAVIGKALWDSMREGYVCMSPDAIGDIKGEIEKLCSKEKCTKEVQAKLQEAAAHLEEASRMAKGL